jgi:hypothetical protein
MELYYGGYIDIDTDVFGIGKYLNTTNDVQILDYTTTGQFLFRLAYNDDATLNDATSTFNMSSVTLNAGNHSFSLQVIMYCENNCSSTNDNIVITIIGSQNSVYHTEVYSYSNVDKTINRGWQAKSFNFTTDQEDTVVVNSVDID